MRLYEVDQVVPVVGSLLVHDVSLDYTPSNGQPTWLSDKKSFEGFPRHLSPPATDPRESAAIRVPCAWDAGYAPADQVATRGPTLRSVGKQIEPPFEEARLCA